MGVLWKCLKKTIQGERRTYMNASLMKSYIVKNNDTQERLAASLGIALATLNAKINGKSSFRQTEMAAIKSRYHMTADEVDAVCFAT